MIELDWSRGCYRMGSLPQLNVHQMLCLLSLCNGKPVMNHVLLIRPLHGMRVW